MKRRLLYIEILWAANIPYRKERIDSMAEITNRKDAPVSLEAEKEQNVEEIKKNLETFNETNVAEVMKDAEEAMSEVGEDSGDQQLQEDSESIGSTDQETDDELEEEESEGNEARDLKNEQDFEKLKMLPYLDLFSEYQKAKNGLADLKSAKEMMDQVGNINDEKYASMVGQMDVAERARLGSSVKDFYEHYDENVAEGERIIDLMARMLMVYDKDMLGSTAFISKSAIEAAERRIPMVAEGPNHDRIVQRLEITKEAYANRVDYSMLFHKLRFPNNVVKLFNKFIKDGPEKSMGYIDKIFMPVFNDKYMQRFRQGVKTLVNDGSRQLSADAQTREDISIYFMTYWLASVYEKEKDSGKCAYVKNLVMNVYDCDPSSNIFDLAGGKQGVGNVCYTIFMILGVITSGTFTSAELHDKINAIIDDLMGTLQKNAEELILDHPGRVVEMDTSLNTITDGMTYEELPELSITKEAKEMDAAEAVEVASEEDDEAEKVEDEEEDDEEETPAEPIVRRGPAN